MSSYVKMVRWDLTLWYLVLGSWYFGILYFGTWYFGIPGRAGGRAGLGGGRRKSKSMSYGWDAEAWSVQNHPLSINLPKLKRSRGVGGGGMGDGIGEGWGPGWGMVGGVGYVWGGGVGIGRGGVGSAHI